MARKQDVLAYDFNSKLSLAKHKALDTLTNVLDAMKAKDADPRILAQMRLAAHAILKVNTLGVRLDYAKEREAEEQGLPPPAPTAPPIVPTSLEALTSAASTTAPAVPLADEAGTHSVKWLQRQLQRSLATAPTRRAPDSG